MKGYDPEFPIICEQDPENPVAFLQFSFVMYQYMQDIKILILCGTTLPLLCLCSLFLLTWSIAWMYWKSFLAWIDTNRWPWKMLNFFYFFLKNPEKRAQWRKNRPWKPWKWKQKFFDTLYWYIDFCTCIFIHMCGIFINYFFII